MKQWKNLILNFVLYTILGGGAIIVLLPLFWMIITACKQSGQAMKFQFLPSSVVEGEKKVLTASPSETATVTFEYDPAGYPSMTTPQSVSVAGEFNGWNKDRDILVKDGDVWITILRNVKPGRYEYKFVINGEKWTEDMTNPQKSESGNSVIELKNGFNKNKTLADQTALEGKMVKFKIYRPNSKTLSVKVEKNEVALVKNEAGFFVGDVPVSSETVEYRIIEPLSFMEGMGKIYTLSNFQKVLFNADFPFGRFFMNSLIVSTLTGLITVFICTLGGYVFAKKKFFLKDQLFVLLLSTMMIPGMIFMVPQFAIVNKLDWINTYQAMIVPHLANIFGLFLLRQYISTIPHSLFEAATIDGASEWQIFRIIIIPLSLPIMVTLFLMTFISQWGNFLWQLIVNTPDSYYRTLPVGLALFRGQHGMNWEMIMAGSCFSIIPIAILFLIAQRFFIEGMTRGAIKE